MKTSQIPDFSDKSFDGMLLWFASMSKSGLLFHPDDAPETIVSIATGKALFSPREARKLTDIVGEMFERFGDEVYEAAYPIFMKCMGGRMDA